MKSTMKKILSILCVVAMVFGCVHIGMFAEEAETPARERSGSAPVSENAPASEPADVGQASPSGQQETQQEQEEQQYASGIVTRYQIRVNGEPIRVPVPARDDVAIARIIVDTAQLIHILLRTPNLRIGMYFVNEADPYNYGKPFYSEDGQLLLPVFFIC